MLLCAEKRGRFIPCRGGGTDTTYYTDAHDVDEDLRTIASFAGRWIGGRGIGITLRSLVDAPTYIRVDVASRLIYLS